MPNSTIVDRHLSAPTLAERATRGRVAVRVSAAAIVAAVSAAFATQAQTHPEKPTYKYEKCYGIAKAGENSCFTATNSCGGTSKVDNDPNAWKYTAVGTCLGAGGTLKAGGKS
jgi:uncharacterized membrane protein